MQVLRLFEPLNNRILKSYVKNIMLNYINIPTTNNNSAYEVNSQCGTAV